MGTAGKVALLRVRVLQSCEHRAFPLLESDGKNAVIAPLTVDVNEAFLQPLFTKPQFLDNPKARAVLRPDIDFYPVKMLLIKKVVNRECDGNCSTKTTGITNAMPKISRMRIAKRMYSLALMTLELPSGVKPISTTTKPGRDVQARAVPAKNSGTAATVKPVA